MLKQTAIKVDIDAIVNQVSKLDFDKSLSINYTQGKLLNGPYVVKPEFKDTPLGDLLDKLDNPGEARLLKLDHAESYTAHSDPDDRFHLSIITNPHAYVIDLESKKMYHLPADGTLWYMDTSITHVAANFGARERIHLNVRVLLPSFTLPGYSLKITGGDFDWKQESYSVLMKFFNTAIKEKIILGFEKVDEKEVLINCDPKILNPYLEKLEKKGFVVEIKQIKE